MELVNAKEDADGHLHPVDHRTNVWAWKIPMEDGAVQYVRLEGGVVLDEVDFGYELNSWCSMTSACGPKPGQKNRLRWRHRCW